MNPGVPSKLAVLAGPFTRVAMAISGRRGIQVVPSTHECCTDGRVIKIPMAADMLPAERRRELHGMLDHESLHVLEEREAEVHGERSPIERFRDLHAEHKTLGFLCNVFEDRRIENKWAPNWPGVKENLDHLNSRAMESLRENYEKKPPNMATQFCMSIGAAMLGESLAGVIDPRITDFVDSEIVPGLAGIPEGEFDSSEERARFAWEKFQSLLVPSMEPEKDEEGGGAGGEPETEVFAELKGEPTAELECEISDLKGCLRAELKTELIEVSKVNGIFWPSQESLARDVWRFGRPNPSSASYAEASAQIADQIGVLRSKQRFHLQTQTRRRIARNMEDGDLDAAQLASVGVGRSDVYTRTAKNVRLDTAIEVLVDLSGSMGPDVSGQKSYMARRCVMALAESWETLKDVSYEIVGFTTGWGVRSGVNSDNTYDRSGIEYIIFKAWNENLLTCRERFSEIEGVGDNTDHEAVMAGARRLAARKEKRKILIVVSDGEPATTGLMGILDGELKRSVTMVSKSGVEVWGIGVLTSAVTKYYNAETGAKNCVINDLDSLAPTLVKMFGAPAPGAGR